VNVRDFGALGNGSHNDQPNIQNAINALPVTGGDVVFPTGNYVINSTITVGNGSTTQFSSRYGVRLKGVGVNTATKQFAGYANTNNVRLTWGGTAGGTMVSVLGPLQGWGIESMTFECAGTGAGNGLLLTSAAYGESRSLNFNGCTIAGVNSTTWATFTNAGGADFGSIGNTFTNTFLNVPNVANAAGIVLDGQSGTANTDYATFINTSLQLFPGSTVVNYGVWLRATDSDIFVNLHIFSGGNPSRAIAFDYTNTAGGGVAGTGGSVWPASVMFFGADSPAIVNVGTPGANPAGDDLANFFYGRQQGNGALCPQLDNVGCMAPNSIVMAPGGNLGQQTGVSCSGAPTSSFTSYNGIVTHC
jgi:hypothetical protein